MGLKVSISIDGAREVDSGVWMAKLEPEEAVTLGECDSEAGPVSVLLVDSDVDYNKATQTITFNPESANLINIGSTSRVIVLSSNGDGADAGLVEQTIKSTDTVKKENPSPAEVAPGSPQKTPPPDSSSDPDLSDNLLTGDKLFLSELPLDLRDLGENLLSGVRNQFPGELTYEPRSAKFDETPEIFWTVKIQPKVKSLRVTVRGRPNNFKKFTGISLTSDRFGYSAFVLKNKSQIRGAIDTIIQAHSNMI